MGPIIGLPALGLALARTDVGAASVLGVGGGMTVAVVGWLAVVAALPVTAGFVQVPVWCERLILLALAVSTGLLTVLTLGLIVAGDAGGLMLLVFCTAGVGVMIFWMNR